MEEKMRNRRKERADKLTYYLPFFFIFSSLIRMTQNRTKFFVRRNTNRIKNLRWWADLSFLFFSILQIKKMNGAFRKWKVETSIIRQCTISTTILRALLLFFFFLFNFQLWRIGYCTFFLHTALHIHDTWHWVQSHEWLNWTWAWKRR